MGIFAVKVAIGTDKVIIMSDPSATLQRLRELKAEEAALRQQMKLQEYAGSYPIQLAWPAKLTGLVRTDPDLIQHRLLETGLLYGAPVDTADAVAAANDFVANLLGTDCFHTVHVEIGGSMNDNNNEEERQVLVNLREKNWYRLYAGAGLKSDWLDSSQIHTESFLPAAEVELSVGLRNILGLLDRTDLQYAVDTHNIGTWKLTHTRPLYSILPSPMADLLLVQDHGSQYNFVARAAIDTSDHEHSSSYRLFQRLFSFRATSSDTPQPWDGSLEYTVNFRDVVPQRHPTVPYQVVSSPEILIHAGSTVKNSLQSKIQYDNTETDETGLPTSGLQVDLTTELAIPPGDVGYVKSHVRSAVHVALNSIFSLHAHVSTGYLHGLSFGGLCSPRTHISDRFFLGGTGSFRGFVPSGIGPRSSHSESKRVGDALGGNYFYAATAMASVATPLFTQFPNLNALSSHFRFFAFCTSGTCTNWSNAHTITDVLRSSRVAAGFGVASKTLGPRVEATYSWPLRFGPHDGRRRFQFGVSLSFD